MKRSHAFTRIEALVSVVVVVLILALVIPMLTAGPSRGHRHQMRNSTHLRGIQSGMVLYAQGNRDFYPGLDQEGRWDHRSMAATTGTYGTASTNGPDVLYRMAVLLRGNYFSPEYMRSPEEIDPDIKPPVAGENMLPGQNYSYAMLNISQIDAPRNKEWRATNSSRTPIASDRNIGGPGSKGGKQSGVAQSIHLDGGYGWRGCVVYNDNHANFETSDLLKTEYALQGEIALDGLFSDEEVTDQGITRADAAMVFKDNHSYSGQTAK